MPSWYVLRSTEEHAGVVAAIAYLLVVGLLWLSYIGTLRTLKNRPDTQAAQSTQAVQAASRYTFAFIIVVAVLFGLVALSWVGLFSSDVYLYGVQGKMQTVYGLNPLVQPPRLLGADPLLQLTPWRDITSAYGPVWLAITAGVSVAAQAIGGAPVAYALLFKTLNLGLLVVGACLIWSITGRLGWSERAQAIATAGFALCPLVIIEWVGNGHNDAPLVVFIIAAIWLHLRGWWPLALAALVAGGLVKLTGFFLLPAYMVLISIGTALTF